MSAHADKEHTSGTSCIYCESAGPFSNEHVFSAGLGGDDSKFMLRNLVCQICNTDRFSPLEAAFLHSSPESFARIFLQPRGRKSKKKNSEPNFKPDSVNIFLPDGSKAEAEIKAGGQAVILPQFWLAENKLHGQCSEVSVLRQFISDLSAQLALESLIVVTKNSSKDQSKYGAIHYAWDGQRYQEISRSSTPTPPRLCIWRDTALISDSSDINSRIFCRSAGQIVFRTTSEMTDAEFLTILRRNASQLALAAEDATPDAPLGQPLVGVSMRFNIGIRERVLAKIGVNLSTYIFGEKFIRQSCFNDVKTAILSGEREIFCTERQVDQIPDDDMLARIFGVFPRKHHVCILTTSHTPQGEVDLLFSVRLYEGILTTLRLAQGLSLPIPETPIFLIVNYVEHKINVINAADFATYFFHPELMDL